MNKGRGIAPKSQEQSFPYTQYNSSSKKGRSPSPATSAWSNSQTLKRFANYEDFHEQKKPFESTTRKNAHHTSTNSMVTEESIIPSGNFSGNTPRAQSPSMALDQQSMGARSGSQARLQDLCPEDKKKIGDLIKKLADEKEEKDRLQQQLDEKAKEFEEKLKSAYKNNEDMISAQTAFHESFQSNLLDLKQLELSNKQIGNYQEKENSSNQVNVNNTPQEKKGIIQQSIKKPSGIPLPPIQSIFPSRPKVQEGSIPDPLQAQTVQKEKQAESGIQSSDSESEEDELEIAQRWRNLQKSRENSASKAGKVEPQNNMFTQAKQFTSQSTRTNQLLEQPQQQSTNMQFQTITQTQSNQLAPPSISKPVQTESRTAEKQRPPQPLPPRAQQLTSTNQVLPKVINNPTLEISQHKKDLKEEKLVDISSLNVDDIKQLNAYLLSKLKHLNDDEILKSGPSFGRFPNQNDSFSQSGSSNQEWDFQSSRKPANYKFDDEEEEESFNTNNESQISSMSRDQKKKPYNIQETYNQYQQSLKNPVLLLNQRNQREQQYNQQIKPQLVQELENTNNNNNNNEKIDSRVSRKSQERQWQEQCLNEDFPKNNYQQERIRQKEVSPDSDDPEQLSVSYGIQSKLYPIQRRQQEESDRSMRLASGLSTPMVEKMYVEPEFLQSFPKRRIEAESPAFNVNPQSDRQSKQSLKKELESAIEDIDEEEARQLMLNLLAKKMNTTNDQNRLVNTASNNREIRGQLNKQQDGYAPGNLNSQRVVEQHLSTNRMQRQSQQWEQDEQIFQNRIVPQQNSMNKVAKKRAAIDEEEEKMIALLNGDFYGNHIQSVIDTFEKEEQYYSKPVTNSQTMQKKQQQQFYNPYLD